ncbi:hypothetical protein [uncultured Comamonas sp.]|uniref:hypothetical protein n=1 Tax=uncultured Comamonas sp. TaxID=114710 RepID=UPI0025F9F2BF|nr:hypothetical protein [uncultured Comamonas sp.]
MNKHARPWGLLTGLLLLACNIHAQPSPATPGYVLGGLDASNDSDGFNEFKPWAQYEAVNGWGLRAGWQRYRMDSWSATGQSLYATHYQKSKLWSSQARLGVNRTDGHDNLVGAWDANYQLRPSTAVGLSAERDIVNSRRGIQQGLTSTSLLGVLDHQFLPRFAVGAAFGSTWFSDDNRRDLLRTRWTFTLSEDQGWYLYALTRHYRNSRPYGGSYFAPERFREAALGVMWKKAITDGLVLSVNADAGRQYIDGEGQQLWHAGLYLSSPHRAPVHWKVGLTSSQDHASALSSSGSGYRYTSLVAFVRMPL